MEFSAIRNSLSEQIEVGLQSTRKGKIRIKSSILADKEIRMFESFQNLAGSRVKHSF